MIMAHDYADKIAKLLKMAEDPSISEEMAANYLTAASELQLKLQLSDADIRAAGGAKNVTDELTTRNVLTDKHGNYVKARRELMFGLAKIFNVRATMYTDRSAIILYGFESDIDFVTQMYTSIVIQLRGHMNLDWAWVAVPKPPWYIKENKRTWCTSYAHGYIARVIERIRHSRRDQENEVRVSTPGAELVLFDRKQAVTKFYDDELSGVKLRASYKNTSINNRDAMVSGYRAGDRADIGHTRVGGQARQISN
jgi:hypothetical protein